jgi:hypothetical protein
MIRDDLPIKGVLDLRRTHSMPDLEFTAHEEITLIKGIAPDFLEVYEPGELYIKLKRKAFDDQYLANYYTHLCPP